MNVNVATNFDVGEEVYYIYETTINNDFYCDEYKWVVGHTTEYEYLPFEISEIHIEHSNNRSNIWYLICGTLFKEKNVFKTLQEAEQECKLRNNKEE